jgi:ATP/maltotriose-dependent transcriptional regulator MalT
MANEPPAPPEPPATGEPPPRADETEETRILRKEVAHQREEESARAAREKQVELLKNRVALAAIVLTTALSFIGNIKGNRTEAIVAAKESAEMARRQGAELWAYYQTKVAERTSLELAHDRLRLDLKKRGLSREDPSIKLEALKLTEYEQRIRDFDSNTQQVFYRVQDLEKQEYIAQREKVEPSRSAFRYDIASKLITLALILLSVTILSNRTWLFVSGLLLGGIGVILAFNGYFLFF